MDQGNLTTTGLSVAVALLIGTAERLGPHGPFRDEEKRSRGLAGPDHVVSP
ncbi:hypothetical protein ACFXJM_14350 [Streptomyces massasporeus]